MSEKYSISLRELSQAIYRDFLFTCKTEKKISRKKHIYNIFAKTLIVGTRFTEVVLTSAHNLCFGSNIRKIGIPRKPQFYYLVFKGVYISWTCFPDGLTVALRSIT